MVSLEITFYATALNTHGQSVRLYVFIRRRGTLTNPNEIISPPQDKF